MISSFVESNSCDSSYTNLVVFAIDIIFKNDEESDKKVATTSMMKSICNLRKNKTEAVQIKFLMPAELVIGILNLYNFEKVKENILKIVIQYVCHVMNKYV